MINLFEENYFSKIRKISHNFKKINYPSTINIRASCARARSALMGA